MLLEPQRPDGVSIIGFFNAPLAIGESARRSARALRSVGYPLTCHNIPLPGREGGVDPGELVNGPPQNRDLIAFLNPLELMGLGHQNPIFNPSRHYLIGFWVWELPVFPAVWAPALRVVHEIWTPSQFNADSYVDLVRRPARVVPYAVPENNISRIEARNELGLPADRYIFLMIYDTNSIHLRKNPEGVLRAFMDAFPQPAAMSPVLVIKMHGTKPLTERLRTLIEDAQSRLSVIVINEIFPEARVRQLQAACDCYVSLHRSEGFGLNIAECMAAGRLTIATDFSGNRDFTKPDNSIPIPYAMRVVGPGDYPWGRGQWWAEPNHEAAVEAMRWAVANPAAADKLAQKAKADIVQNYSFENVGRMTALALQDHKLS